VAFTVSFFSVMFVSNGYSKFGKGLIEIVRFAKWVWGGLVVRYIVEDDVRSGNVDQVSEVVSRALVSAFGGIDNLRVVSTSTYVAILRVGQPLIWKEVQTK
jgi:hypothetical protein